MHYWVKIAWIKANVDMGTTDQAVINSAIALNFSYVIP